MSSAVARVRLPRDASHRRRPAAASGPFEPAPRVAILCSSARGRVAASAIALALARARGIACALASVVGGGEVGSLAWTPSARRVARGLRECGLPATASGRLVWVADRRGAAAAAADGAAALSAEVGRAAARADAPAALALPFARTAALDRVLAWHDAIVVLREPDASQALLEHALASLAALGRPVAAMAPPSRPAAALAVAGLVPPPEAVDAVAWLGDGGGSRSGRGGG